MVKDFSSRFLLFLCSIHKVSLRIKPPHKRTKTFFLALRSSCRQIDKVNSLSLSLSQIILCFSLSFLWIFMAVAAVLAKGGVDFSHVFSLKHNPELFILGFGLFKSWHKISTSTRFKSCLYLWFNSFLDSYIYIWEDLHGNFKVHIYWHSIFSLFLPKQVFDQIQNTKKHCFSFSFFFTFLLAWNIC